RLNGAVAGAAGRLLAAGAQVLHAAGPAQAVDVAVPDGQGPYLVVPYLDRMDLAYAAADLAVCRAGAMTCAELAAVGLPAVYVPLPHGNGEQRLNALPVVQAGGGLLVDDAELTPAWVGEHVPPLLADGEALAVMAAATAALGRRDADERLVALVREAVSAR
ncbi:MAG: UDP-N-acetylglucosamine--N-acetylmuramyl-(pentapeptide) pyrophosphoryl-undecaprenol N-acetylglucosamine transferase, partial [Pseudonocardia sp.]